MPRPGPIVLKPAAKATFTGLYENRIRFAFAIQTEAPFVLKRLREDVLPHWVPDLHDPSAKRPVDLSPEVKAFSSAFSRWCADFHLKTRSGWLEEFACQTLHTWAVDPVPSSDTLSWSFPAIEILGKPRAYPIRHPEPQFFQWLVRWQVLGETCDTIADLVRDRSRDVEAAQQAVNGLKQRARAGLTPSYADALKTCSRLASAGLAERARDRTRSRRSFSTYDWRPARQGIELAVKRLARYLELPLRPARRPAARAG